MHTTSKIFLDSSVLIEGYKGRHQEYYNALVKNPGLECCINGIVCSEYWYNLLGLIGNASPLTLKGRGGISATMNYDKKRFEIFQRYTVLTLEPEATVLALDFMQKYNLLPNDALILATCVTQKILFIASHDSDFDFACKAEGIQLVIPDNYRQILASKT